MEQDNKDDDDDGGIVIGIDLGTTYSCVAVCLEGRITIIENSMGRKTTPSYVTIKDKEIFVGDASKELAHVNPRQTIFDVKRILGRNFSDPHLQSDMKLWPFEIVQDDNFLPKIKLGEDETFFPEEISAKLLRYLRQTAVDKLGRSVNKVVLTVPAYFNNSQRQGTKDAATIAGLKVVRIISEPTAAALAYNLHNNFGGPRNCLIFDFGGGTLDVALATVEGGVIEIKGVDGHSHLGGEDLDTAMVHYCLEKFRVDLKIDVNEKRRAGNFEEKTKALKALHRLKVECQRQKEFLSSGKKVLVSLDVFFGGHDLVVHFDRPLFNSLNGAKFQLCLDIVQRLLNHSNLSREDIDDVVLVGGSSRIPKIQEMLSDIFGKEKVKIDVEADETVARGAAIMAAHLDILSPEKISAAIFKNDEPGQSSNRLGVMNTKSVLEIVHLPIGIQMERRAGDGRNFAVVIPKNEKIPCARTRQYVTVMDNQPKIEINVYEGDGKTTEENHFLGHFTLSNIPICRQGEQVDVRMEVDANGILQVSAKMPNYPTSHQTIVIEQKGRLQTEEIERLAKMDEDLRINFEDPELIDEMETDC